MLGNDADELVLGIFGKYLVCKLRVLAPDMQKWYTVVFDDPDDAKQFLGENPPKPGTAVGPDGAGVMLYVRPQRAAQERRKVELMTTV